MSLRILNVWMQVMLMAKIIQTKNDTTSAEAETNAQDSKSEGGLS